MKKPFVIHTEVLKNESTSKMNVFLEGLTHLIGEYSGDTNQGMPHGIGILRFWESKNDNRTMGKDFGSYTGCWHEGRMHGKGLYTSPEGIRYDGKWISGIFTQGKVIFPDEEKAITIKNAKPVNERLAKDSNHEPFDYYRFNYIGGTDKRMSPFIDYLYKHINILESNILRLYESKSGVNRFDFYEQLQQSTICTEFNHNYTIPLKIFLNSFSPIWGTNSEPQIQFQIPCSKKLLEQAMHNLPYPSELSAWFAFYRNQKPFFWWDFSYFYLAATPSGLELLKEMGFKPEKVKSTIRPSHEITLGSLNQLLDTIADEIAVYSAHRLEMMRFRDRHAYIVSHSTNENLVFSSYFAYLFLKNKFKNCAIACIPDPSPDFTDFQVTNEKGETTLVRLIAIADVDKERKLTRFNTRTPYHFLLVMSIDCNYHPIDVWLFNATQVKDITELWVPGEFHDFYDELPRPLVSEGSPVFKQAENQINLLKKLLKQKRKAI